MRPVEPDEVETRNVRATDPHRVGADRVPVLQAHLSASRARAAHKRATGKLPAVAKPATKAATKATPSSSANPAFGSPAWRAKYGKKKSAAKPPVTTQPEGSTYG
jgi:hypothetical protein